MVIYADLYIIMNWTADFVLLKMITSGKKIPLWRIIAGACIGSIGALFLLGTSEWLRIPGGILLAVIMVITVLAKRYRYCWKKSILLLYGYGFLYSGFVQTLYQWLLFSSDDAAFGTVCAILLWILLIWICNSGIRYFEKRYGNAEMRKELIDMEIMVFQRSVQVTAFIDNGNTLRERRTGYPVMIIQNQEGWEPEQWVLNHGAALYWIPYKTADNENACMLGIRPEWVRWTEIRGKRTIERSTKEVIIATAKIRALDSKGRYNAIISPCMLDS